MTHLHNIFISTMLAAGVVSFVMPAVVLGDDGSPTTTTTAATTPATSTRPAFTLGKDTTRIVAPLLPDGRPDYVTALDQALSKGVTPENNVVVGLLEVFGTGREIILEKTRVETLKRLGITQEQTARYQSFQDYLKKRGMEYNTEMQAVEKMVCAQPWDAENFPYIAQWLAENDKALDQIATASTRDRYYWPPIASSGYSVSRIVLLPQVRHMREGGKALTIRAMRRLYQGQIKESQGDLIAAHRLGRLMSQGSTLIEKLVGVAIERAAAEGDVQLAEGLKPEAAKAYLIELGQLRPIDDPAKSLDEAERFVTLDAVLSLSKNITSDLLKNIHRDEFGEASTSGILTTQVDWDQVLKIINSWYDRMAAAMRLPTYAERKVAMVALENEIEKRSVAKSTTTDLTERMTCVLMVKLIPSVVRARELTDRGLECSDLGMLAIALAAYRGEKGAYPEKLEALAPAYLKEVPRDIFADAPLKYRKEGVGYVLYSIGPNLKDDGGVAEKSEAKGDLVVRMAK